MNIVLYEPEIPQNTGNVVRTCAATGSVLHLIRPLGFAWDDRKLKRAGLDYWRELDIRFYDGWEELLARAGQNARMWLLSTKAGRLYTEADFRAGDYLVFGRETSGVPARLHETLPALRIPMRPGLRSLNMSNAVALVLYEALRVRHFEGLL